MANGDLPSPTIEKFEKLQDYQPRQATPGLVMLNTFEYLKDNPYELFWFLGERRRSLYKVFPFLRGVSEDHGAAGAEEVDAVTAELNTRGHAEIFLDVLEKFPALNNKTIIVIGDDPFIKELRKQHDLPRHILPVDLQHDGNGYYYPVDTHYNRIGHEDVALSILGAFERDSRFREGCAIGAVSR